MPTRVPSRAGPPTRLQDPAARLETGSAQDLAPIIRGQCWAGCCRRRLLRLSRTGALLGATVLTYGLVADPQTVAKNVQSLASVMPRDAAKLIGEQLMSVVQTSGGKKGLGLLLAIAIAIFGARNAAVDHHRSQHRL